MARPLEQAVVVVTGASSGIGRAAALRIARRGGALALCARNEGPLAEVAAECEAAGAAVLTRALDVAEEEAVEAFAAAVEGGSAGSTSGSTTRRRWPTGPSTTSPPRSFAASSRPT